MQSASDIRKTNKKIRIDELGAQVARSRHGNVLLLFGRGISRWEIYEKFIMPKVVRNCGIKSDCYSSPYHILGKLVEIFWSFWKSYFQIHSTGKSSKLDDRVVIAIVYRYLNKFRIWSLKFIIFGIQTII